MNISILSGSARALNNTIRVGKALELRLQQAGHTTSLVDFQLYDIPLMNQGGIDENNLTSFQQQLTNSMRHADVVLLITPEYNWSTTPEILNFLHRMSDIRFRDSFNNKVFATIGVSTGKGGKAPALHLHSILNKIISFNNMDSLVSAKIFEAHFTKEVLDEQGHSLGNELFDKGLNDFIHYTLRIANRWKQS